MVYTSSRPLFEFACCCLGKLVRDLRWYIYKMWKLYTYFIRWGWGRVRRGGWLDLKIKSSINVRAYVKFWFHAGWFMRIRAHGYWWGQTPQNFATRKTEKRRQAVDSAHSWCLPYTIYRYTDEEWDWNRWGVGTEIDEKLMIFLWLVCSFVFHRNGD